MKTNKFKILIWAIFILTISTNAVGQTDNGGGMGGTGISDRHQQVSPATIEEPCIKERSVGIYQIRSIKEMRTKKQGYVCSGQILRSRRDEEIDIHFRSGEKIRILESSQIIVEKIPD